MLEINLGQETDFMRSAPLDRTASVWTMLASDIESFCAQQKVHSFRAKQIQNWIFKNESRLSQEMTNLPKALIEALESNLDCDLLKIHEQVTAKDGATKLLLKTAQGQLIETVILRYKERTSLCVSSQVGCKLACTFCQTGKLGFFRHLSAKEIIAQFILANALLKPEGRKVSHVVFMGHGRTLG